MNRGFVTTAVLGIIAIVSLIGGLGWYSSQNQSEQPLQIEKSGEATDPSFGAPTQRFERDLFPATDSTYNFGTSTRRWLLGSFDNASTTILTIDGITGSTQCLQVDTSGNVTGTGAGCGGSGADHTFPFDLAPAFGSSAVSTSTLQVYLGGIVSTASSTMIATTTFASDINVGTTSPYTDGMVNIEILSPHQHGLIIQGADSQDAHLFMLRNAGGKRLFNVQTSGETEIFHEATENGDHTLHLETDTGGFGDVVGVFSDYDAGTLAAGEDASNILLTLDRRNTTGGDIHGILVITTIGSADATALEVGAGVNVIRQSSGTFGDMDECTDNGTDILSSCTSAASDVTLFDNNNDELVIGDAAQFTAIDVDLATNSNKNINLKVEFSTGSDTWTEFSPTDGTDGFQDSSQITWELSDIPTWETGTSTRYFIRLTRTRAGNIATPPVENLLQISNTTPFFWNLDGDTTVRNATTTSATTTNLSISGQLDADTLTSALTLTGSTGVFAEYTGTTCTNQLIEDLSVLGVATCSSINNAFWSGADLTVGNGGTGVSSFTQYLLLYADTTTSLSQVSIGSSGQVLTSNGAGSVASFQTLSIAAGEYAAASIDGDDINSNLAGRSLTLTSASPDTLDADVELYTYGITANLFATTTADGIATTSEAFISVQIPVASTITRFTCYADDSGTSTIRATVSTDGISAGTDILFADGTNCGSDIEIATTSFSTTALGQRDWIHFFVDDAEPTGSRPRVLYVSFEATKDD